MGAPHEQPIFTPAFEKSVIFPGAKEYSTAEELLAPVDRKGWAARVRQFDPVDHNTAATMVASSLDASAEEWKKGAKIQNGLFTG